VPNLLLQSSPDGLYCPPGDFFIDPWNPTPRAVITHSHSDHARPGSGTYLTAAAGERLLRWRLGSEAAIETVRYGETRSINGVTLSLHPAGHVLGSAQVRVEYQGEVWVVSGDYKLAPDPTCAAFEPLRCHTFITESTFGLPIYRWPPQTVVFDEINQWWRRNQETGKASVVFAYALGKAQRLLAGVDCEVGPIFAHGAVRNLNRSYRESGVSLPEVGSPDDTPKGYDWSRALILAPPWAHGSPWIRRFGAVSPAFASGWMRIRGTRRRKSIDRGFVLSDHADWPGLLAAITHTQAERIWVTHGYRSPLVRWLTEQGKDAQVIETRWEDDELEAPEVEKEKEAEKEPPV
jgi:putative mRNA 3-end processing factor